MRLVVRQGKAEGKEDGLGRMSGGRGLGDRMPNATYLGPCTSTVVECWVASDAKIGQFQFF